MQLRRLVCLHPDPLQLAARPRRLPRLSPSLMQAVGLPAVE